MIEKMKKLHICCLRSQADDIMSEIIRCGAVQLVRTQAMLEDDGADALTAGEYKHSVEEEAQLDNIEKCIKVLKPFAEKKGIFDKRPEVAYEHLAGGMLVQEAMEVCRHIEDILNELAALGEKLEKTEFRRAACMPWRTLDVSADDMETERCKASCYILHEPITIENVEAAAADRGLDLYTEKIHEERGRLYLAIALRREDEIQLKEIMNDFGGREFQKENINGTVSEFISSCDVEAAALNDSLEIQQKKLREMSVYMKKLQMASDALRIRLQILSGREKFMHTDKVDIISGWIPKTKIGMLADRLNESDCFFEYTSPGHDEEFPVLLSNSRIVAPFGAITEMYSLPSPHSIDTNWAIGLFFFIFFGMMLSDAGYGMVLTAAGLLGAEYLDVSDSMKRIMRMIGIAGISTVFWGILYGSWFGDIIPVAAEVFSGRVMEIPKVIDPLNEPMKVLILSCVLGVIHLFAGMGIKAYIMIKRGDVKGAVFDVGLWYVFLTGLMLLLAPGAAGNIGKVMSIAGAAGLVLTQGRHKPTVAGKLISGVMSLYGVTGYFSDVLSYSRILALGLATGVIASVVNILATMAGSSVLGIVLFVVIFCAGHLLNLAINALGAYVHSARLQYVEFFGKYYEGGGEKFSPLKIETEYVKVTEE